MLVFVNVSKSFYRLDLSGGFAFQKNFFRSTVAGVPCTPPTPTTLNSGAVVDAYTQGICRDGDPTAPTSRVRG